MDYIQKKCLISQRECSVFSTIEEKLVFIAGSTSQEFEKDIEMIINSLKEKGYNGYFATRQDQEKGLDAFCDKTCSKILQSQFCIVLLNSPKNKLLETAFPPEEEIKKRFSNFPSYKEILYPSPNVWFEYGLMVGANKRVIPFLREGYNLPFDVQHIDIYLYDDLESLKEKIIVGIENIVDARQLFSQKFLNRAEIYSLLEEYSNSDLPSFEALKTKLEAFVFTIVDVIRSSELDKFGDLVKAIESLYSKENISSGSRPIVYGESAYLLFFSIGMKILYEEKWDLINLLLKANVRIDTENKNIPIACHPIGRKIGEFIKRGKCIQEWVWKCKDLWQYYEQDEVINAFVQWNFLCNFYYWQKKEYRCCYPYFLSYYASRISPLLERIFVEEEYDILTRIFIQSDEKQLLKALAEYLLKGLPEGHVDPFSIHFELNDFHENLMKIIMSYLR